MGEEGREGQKADKRGWDSRAGHKPHPIRREKAWTWSPPCWVTLSESRLLSGLRLHMCKRVPVLSKTVRVWRGPRRTGKSRPCLPLPLPAPLTGSRLSRAGVSQTPDSHMLPTSCWPRTLGDAQRCAPSPLPTFVLKILKPGEKLEEEQTEHLDSSPSFKTKPS